MVGDISSWLKQLGLGEYVSAFAENRIDGEMLRELSADDLKELGVAALGDRKKLLKAIAALVVAETAIDDKPTGPPPEAYE